MKTLPTFVAMLALAFAFGLFLEPQSTEAAKKRAVRWLTLEVWSVSSADDATSKVGALSGLHSKLDDHQETRGFVEVTDSARAVTGSIWANIEALEDAALALDGKVEASPSRRLQFREVRSSTYDKKTKMGHFELVVHRTRPGTTREQNLKAFDAAEKDFSKGEGLLGHSLWISPNGEWLHLLRWRSAAVYQKTGKTLMGTKVGAWIKTLDFQRFEVFRGDVD